MSKSPEQEVDVDRLIAEGFAQHGYRQGTKECVAFYRGACWQAQQSFKTCDGCYDSDDCRALGCARQRQPDAGVPVVQPADHWAADLDALSRAADEFDSIAEDSDSHGNNSAAESARARAYELRQVITRGLNRTHGAMASDGSKPE